LNKDHYAERVAKARFQLISRASVSASLPDTCLLSFFVFFFFLCVPSLSALGHGRKIRRFRARPVHPGVDLRAPLSARRFENFGAWDRPCTHRAGRSSAQGGTDRRPLPRPPGSRPLLVTGRPWLAAAPLRRLRPSAVKIAPSAFLTPQVPACRDVKRRRRVALDRGSSFGIVDRFEDRIRGPRMKRRTAAHHFFDVWPIVRSDFARGPPAGSVPGRPRGCFGRARSRPPRIG